MICVEDNMANLYKTVPDCDGFNCEEAGIYFTQESRRNYCPRCLDRHYRDCALKAMKAHEKTEMPSNLLKFPVRVPTN